MKNKKRKMIIFIGDSLKHGFDVQAVLTLIALIVTAGATVAMAMFNKSLVDQLKLTQEQNRLNKISMLHTNYPLENFLQSFETLCYNFSARNFKLDYTTVLTKEDTKYMVGDSDVIFATDICLEFYEKYAFAINIDIIPEQYIYKFYADKVITIYKILEPLIKEIRKISSFTNSYEQFEILAKRWKERREKEAKYKV